MLAKPQGFPRKLGGCAGLDPRLRSAVSAGVGDGERGLRRGLRAPGVGVRPKWVLEYSPSNKRIRYFVSITYVRTGLWTAHKFCGGGESFRELSSAGLIADLEVRRGEAALATAEARLEQAQAVLDPSTAEVDIARQRITQERARGEATIARLRGEREQFIERQAEIQNRLSSDQSELDQMEVEIGLTVIRAPTSGIIQELRLRNSGQVVQSGETVARIAPRDSPLVIKAYIAPQDIGQVEINQTVYMRVSACPYPDYGTLKGTVNAVSPDAIPLASAGVDIWQGGRGESPVYEATIQPDTLVLSIGGQECAIQSGMEGRADIVLGEEAVLGFLLRKARLLVDF